jgi:serine protease Do
MFSAKNVSSIFLFLLAIGVVMLGAYYYYTLNARVALLASALEHGTQQYEALSKELDALAQAYAELSGKPTEVIRREVVRETSQDELLITAVGQAAPSVVSIVVTKEVPNLEIVYINPFGDDPFFRDFGVQIPQYRQRGTTEQKIGAGTGFIVNAQGYILTNRHVVEDREARYTVLLTDGSQKPANVMYRDNDIDVAILKIAGSGYAAISLGNSDALKLGQSVFAVGNALGEYNNTVSVGIISGLNRDLEAFGGERSEKLTGVIQTDAAINPGNSGGPLVNFSGEVVGVNVAVARGAENIGFAIPINILKPIITTHVR